MPTLAPTLEVPGTAPAEPDPNTDAPSPGTQIDEDAIDDPGTETTPETDTDEGG